MVLKNVTKFHKILIKSIQLRERTWFQMVNFHKQRALTTKGLNYWKHGVIWTIIIEFEEDIVVLNNVTNFHKILIKSIGLREQTLFQMVNIHKQRVITTESMVQYGR